MLEDGRYDVFVVDATAVEGEAHTVRLELTVLGGAHKGEVVTVQATGLPGGETAMLGLPGTLVVDGGEPSVRLEP